ncbi:thiol reductant ABC exporter subunit CydC [Parashewanella spongiae]|uniref:Thiol reductant ABC exporter subunit CydC n=1 Tax=Parashewanella spongiae TaxID=342950 RepID=A0A3A6THC2_9GAMM|nr:thiol reductant ABC exporter subunit CydC [Parashewanella spongiae]MCL1078375.1 thiol reductant ABC exporter subunit CydC [Parashewanella spongiae]RJY07090.1 thiol reductant ABC exporter subunit CydC [Parashewanella spongiae]
MINSSKPRKNSTSEHKLSELLPFIRMFKQQWTLISLGMLLSMLTLTAGIALLGLSGWFLSATALAGLTALGIKQFNFYTPAAGVRFLAIVRTVGRYGERLVTHQGTLQILTQIRIWLWRQLQRLSISQVSKLRRGDVLNRLLTDIDTLDQLYLRILAPLMSYFILSLFFSCVIGFWDEQLAWIIGLGLLFIGVLLPFVGYLSAQRPAIAVIEAKRQYRIELLDLLTNQLEITMYAALSRYRSKIELTEQRLYQVQLWLIQRNALLQAGLILLHGLILIVALYFAGNGAIAGSISGPVFALIVFVMMAMMELLIPLSLSSQQLSACVLAASRINQLTEQHAQFEYGSVQEQAITGNLNILDGYFGYTDEQVVLKKLNLSILDKQKVAFVGHSGCGKSTLLKLLTRQQNLQSGTILLDGKPIESYSELALSQSITYVEQSAQIFSASLKDNLLIALADGEIVSDKKLISTLRQVGLEKLLNDDGLDLWIGDGGRLLSGGERRRISIARALLRTAPIVLLDEPTEGLDLNTEKQILELIFDVWKDKTVLVVTHKTSVFPFINEWHLMENGRLLNLTVAQGLNNC